MHEGWRTGRANQVEATPSLLIQGMNNNVFVPLTPAFVEIPVIAVSASVPKGTQAARTRM
jgi:hypothetical protein